jgi:hypothetical protein
MTAMWQSIVAVAQDWNCHNKGEMPNTPDSDGEAAIALSKL